MAITKNGIEIRNLGDWRIHGKPKRADQWVPDRSAMEAARAWLEGGGERLPREIDAALSAHPAFGPVLRWDAQVEVQLHFDAFAGEPRNSDLVVNATDVHGTYVIAVEAKADEPFGDTVAKTLVAAERRHEENPRSNGVVRVLQLRQADDMALFTCLCGGESLQLLGCVVRGLRFNRSRGAGGQGQRRDAGENEKSHDTALSGDVVFQLFGL